MYRFIHMYMYITCIYLYVYICILIHMMIHGHMAIYVYVHLYFYIYIARCTAIHWIRLGVERRLDSAGSFPLLKKLSPRDWCVARLRGGQIQPTCKQRQSAFGVTTRATFEKLGLKGQTHSRQAVGEPLHPGCF